MRTMRSSVFPTLNLAVVAAALLVSVPASAQESRWSVDFLAGVAAPTSEVEGNDLGTGLGFEGAVHFRLQNHLFAYAGWDWHRFAPDASFAGPDVDFEETGYVFGLSFEHPFGSEDGQGAAYRLRAGATVNHIELEDADGELIGDSRHGLGWEAGAGLVVPVSSNWKLIPEVRFRSTVREVEVGPTPVDVGLHYFTFGVGFSRRF